MGQKKNLLRYWTLHMIWETMNTLPFLAGKDIVSAKWTQTSKFPKCERKKRGNEEIFWGLLSHLRLHERVLKDIFCYLYYYFILILKHLIDPLVVWIAAHRLWRYHSVLASSSVWAGNRTTNLPLCGRLLVPTAPHSLQMVTSQILINSLRTCRSRSQSSGSLWRLGHVLKPGRMEWTRHGWSEVIGQVTSFQMEFWILFITLIYFYDYWRIQASQLQSQ